MLMSSICWAFPVGHQRLGEGLQSLSAAAFDHQEKIMSLRRRVHWSRSGGRAGRCVSSTETRRTCAQELLALGRFDIMGRHAPEPGVVFLQSVGDRRHRHLPTQEHDKGFKKQRKAAAFPGPRHRHALDAMFRAIAARHARFQHALILEEVQVLPPLGAGVMRQAKLAALRAAKALPSLKIQLQKQLAWFAFKSTFPHLPSPFELQGRRKQYFRCHRPYSVPLAKDLQGPAMRPLFLVNRVLRAPDSKKVMLDHPFTTAGSRET